MIETTTGVSRASLVQVIQVDGPHSSRVLAFDSDGRVYMGRMELTVTVHEGEAIDPHIEWEALGTESTVPIPTFVSPSPFAGYENHVRVIDGGGTNPP